MNMSLEPYTESHSSSPAEVMEMGGRNRQLTGYGKLWQGMKGQNRRGTKYNRLLTGGVIGMITWWIITTTTIYGCKYLGLALLMFTPSNELPPQPTPTLPAQHKRVICLHCFIEQVISEAINL